MYIVIAIIPSYIVDSDSNDGMLSVLIDNLPNKTQYYAYLWILGYIMYSW